MGARRSIHRLQRRSPPLEYSRAFGGGVVSRGVAGTESTDVESTLSLSSHKDHLHPLPSSVDADTVCTSFLASDCAFSTFGRCAKTPAEESRLCHGCRKVIPPLRPFLHRLRHRFQTPTKSVPHQQFEGSPYDS